MSIKRVDSIVEQVCSIFHARIVQEINMKKRKTKGCFFTNKKNLRKDHKHMDGGRQNTFDRYYDENLK